MKRTMPTPRSPVFRSKSARIEPLETRIAPAFVAGSVNLADLNGTTGSAFHGETGGDTAGNSVSAAGDVNGDGFGDFIIGASGVGGGSGAAYVIFGTAAGFPADTTLNATFLDGTKGFALFSDDGGDQAGTAVSAAGDVNGDGFDDVIVGAPIAVGAGTIAGAAYVVFGKAGGFAASMDLGELNGSDGFELLGGQDDDRVGSSVSGAGDVNGDGFDDVIVGADGLGDNGGAFIIYGKAGGFAKKLTLSGLTAAQGVRLDGVSSGDNTGAAVSGAGDVNGDGFDDVIVGAPAFGNNDRGAAFVVFGGPLLPASIALNTLGGATGFRAEGDLTADNAGASLGGAGDVNGDGIDDVLIGARRTGGNGTTNGPGVTYVIFGNTLPFGPQFTLDIGASFALTGTGDDQAGFSVSGAGDVNGDGIDDLIVSVPQFVAGDEGGAYVIFGRPNIASAPPTYATLDGSTGFKLAGEEAASLAGFSVSGAGDVNGDGFADLLVGAPNSGGFGNYVGQTYLVYGGPSGAFVNPTIAATGKTATWTDVDGDLVTLTVTKGTLDATNFLLLANSAADSRARLLRLDVGTTPGGLSEFEGANITLTAKRAAGGDGKVNLGFLRASNTDLGAVKIGGDLARMFVGDASDDMALKSLTLDSVGLFGTRLQDARGEVRLLIAGPAGPVKIAGDFREGRLFGGQAATAGTGTIASITIGGSFIGGERSSSGQIFADALGPVKIGGDLVGGAGFSSGFLGADRLTSLTIGGSVLGAGATNSGAVQILGPLGPVSIGGDLVGRAGFSSGSIFAVQSLGRVFIKGSQLGGAGVQSGSIAAGDLTVAVAIAGVSIGGDARAGSGSGSGGIFAGGALGPVSIGGDVVGTAEQPYIIAGVGPLTGAKSLAIASVKIGGDFERGQILGGYAGDQGGLFNGHAQIGAITVGGDWIASSAVAGLLTNAGATNANGSFGNGDDAFIGAGAATNPASIKSVTIKGAARGTFEDGDRFAIVAEQIGSVSIGGVKLPLTKSAPGADPANNLAAIHVGATPDFVVREVSRTAAAPAETFTAPPAAGPRTAQPASFALGTLASADGFRIGGAAAGDNAGLSVRAAGDVNGDGLGDFIVGARGADEGGTDRGAAYVVFGQAGGRASFDVTTLDGTSGFKVFGAANGDEAGYSVAAAGDVNGDGFADVIVGAKNADGTRGAAYLVFGRSSFMDVGAAGIALGTLDGTTGLRLLGAAVGDYAGFNVDGAGDVNGDGFDDVIVGAVAADDQAGAAYVVFGQSRFASAPTAGFTIGLGSLDGADGVKLAGEDPSDFVDVGDEAGFVVRRAGDVNGDGFDDVLVGAPFAEEAGDSGINSNRGSAYLVFGRNSFTGTPSLDLGALQGTAGVKFTGAAQGDRAGYAASGAGDVNGDGFDDLILSAVYAGGTGAAWVVFGRSAFVPGPVVDFAVGLGTLPESQGFKLSGIAASDKAGYSVSGAGDVNGDGFADLLVGATRADEGGTTAAADRGAAYVVFGKAGGFGAGFSLSALDGSNGFKLSGAADDDRVGGSVSDAGDVNGDGFADVIVGAKNAGGTGAAYVIYGGPSGEFIDPTFSADGKTAMWTDVDGDKVTLKVSKGTLDATNFKLLAKSTTDARAQLLALNLGNEFEGADVSLTAKRAVGGDGKVNVGAINALFTDLGKVTIGGDLGKITVGDGDLAAPVKSLTIGSLGVFGARTQDTGGNLSSQIFGPAGAIKILGDVSEATLLFQNIGAPGSADSVTVGGSVIGGKTNFSGLIAAINGLGPVKIAGDLVGAAGIASGYLEGPNINSLTIGGSMLGGAGLFSGTALAGSLVFNGVPSLTGSFGNVTIGGDQRGGDGLFSGSLASGLGMGKVSIGRDQVGGAGSASGIVFAQNAGADIASVTIGGDARGGTATFSGGILAGGALGPVTIQGDVIGTAEQAYLIRGGGALVGSKSVALMSLKVGGDFDHALILAGYGNNNAPVNGHAQIGAITIGGDWIASSVAAGLLPFTGAALPANLFGNGDDVFINAGPVGVIASIASITIKGRAVGSLEAGDRFGIVAESIGSISIGGTKLGLTSNADTTPIFIGPTRDFVVREVIRV